MNGTLKTDEVIENKIYFIIEYIRAWNSYVETNLLISLCSLCDGFSKHTIITSLFQLSTELIM